MVLVPVSEPGSRLGAVGVLSAGSQSVSGRGEGHPIGTYGSLPTSTSKTLRSPQVSDEGERYYTSQGLGYLDNKEILAAVHMVREKGECELVVFVIMLVFLVTRKLVGKIPHHHHSHDALETTGTGLSLL